MVIWSLVNSFQGQGQVYVISFRPNIRMTAKSKSQIRWTLCHCTLPPAEKILSGFIGMQIYARYCFSNSFKTPTPGITTCVCDHICKCFIQALLVLKTSLQPRPMGSNKVDGKVLTDWWTQSLGRPFGCLDCICFFALCVNVSKFVLLYDFLNIFLDFTYLTASPGWGGCSAETWPVTRHLRDGRKNVSYIYQNKMYGRFMHLLAGLPLCHVKDVKTGHTNVLTNMMVQFSPLLCNIYTMIATTVKNLNIVSWFHLLHFSQSCKFSLKANTDPVKTILIYMSLSTGVSILHLTGRNLLIENSHF